LISFVQVLDYQNKSSVGTTVIIPQGLDIPGEKLTYGDLTLKIFG
jgi:hypothetical protein